jgi:hypothetical protein
MMPTVSLAEKQRQFNAAMERYSQWPGYFWLGQAVSVLIVGSQMLLAVLLFSRGQDFLVINLWAVILVLVAAYIAADGINGWVHLFMDNHDDYVSLFGPLVASFHLHHRTPRYARNPLWLVYFREAGSKLWLALCMIPAVFAVWFWHLHPFVATGILAFSVFSSVAEVSHYLCHTTDAGWARFLGRIGILLSARLHARHHREDNVDYAFLNGMSNPLINLVARRFFLGYKQRSDLHYATYIGPQTANRQ